MGISEGEIQASEFLNFPGEAGMQKCYCNEATFFFFFVHTLRLEANCFHFPNYLSQWRENDDKQHKVERLL